MALMTIPATAAPQLLRDLSAAMEETHRAVLHFDGTAFASGIAAEQRLCSQLARRMQSCSPFPRALFKPIEKLQRQRRGLIPATQRTVRALWGVSAVVRANYEPAVSELY